MITAIPTFELTGHRTAFSHTEKDPNKDNTYALPKSSPLFSQKSDTIELSPDAIKKQGNEEKSLELLKSDDDTKININGQQLSEEEQKEIEKIRKNGRNIKRQELVYRAIVGNHVKGAASFEYDLGPDGIKYAVAGHTTIDTRPVINNPEASIRKAQAIKRTKLDRSVAVEVEKMEREARLEIKEEQRKESDETTKVTNEKGSIGTTHHKKLNPELQELV